MSANCTNEPKLTGWCAGIAGDGPEERRSELFWQYLNAQVPPQLASEIRGHLDSCEDCHAVLAAERLLLASRSSGKVVLAVCPLGEELLNYAERSPAQGPWRRLEIKRHLDRCALCREEVNWAAQRVIAQAPAVQQSPVWAGWFTWKRVSWAGAVASIALVFALVYPSQFGSRRFARYAQLPDIPYETMVAEFGASHPEDLPRFRAATQLVSLGEYAEGERALQQLENRYAEDRGVMFFKGYVAARGGRWKDAALLCTRAEPSSLDGFRCWYLANVALMAGDLDLARKEARHASGHSPYKELAQRLEQQLN
jgi:hypothetical protein